MDVQLLLLIALIVAVIVLATRQHSRGWPGRPGWQYRRVFSAGFAGLLFFVSGIIGWDLSHSHGWFRGTRWADGPIWWQIALGAILLLLAVFWARRVPPPVTR
jgi:hypothetical protein